MAQINDDLNGYFCSSSDNGLPSDVLGELESILRLHSISAQELFYKWESYSLKMGSEETVLDLDTVRMFKKDVQDGLEREHRGKHISRNDRRTAVAATPRAVANGDVLGMLDEIAPNRLPRRLTVNGIGAKRKGNFETPSTTKVSRPETNGSPGTFKAPGRGENQEGPKPVPFSERRNGGQVIETLNDHLSVAESPIAPFAEPRIKFTLNTDMKKFSYKPMAMRLSESSEVLDERIDEFTNIVQKAHNLDDTAFGNAACQSTVEIIAVGRIASDTPESKLVPASLVLETSRRMGAGRRVPLRLHSDLSYQFFPGQIVALRGQNASGEDFVVSEILAIPFLPDPRSAPAVIEANNEKLGDVAESTPLNVLIASGPYCADENLAFEPLNALCSKAAEESVDALILSGPFLDVEHPMIASGNFDLPDLKALDHHAVMSTLFRHLIAGPLQRLCNANPNITIVLIPSVRDAVSKHVSWPQERLSAKDLGLPRQIKTMTNPCTFWLNEIVVAVSSQDVLGELRREEVVGGSNQQDLLTRLPRHLIEQRHYFPLFPPVAREHLVKIRTESGLATGACLDVGYLKLGEMLNVRPDVLVTPSVLPAFARVVEAVTVINPGTLSKRKGPGTYSQLSIQPRILSDAEKAETSVPHKVYERARIDVVRI